MHVNVHLSLAIAALCIAGTAVAQTSERFAPVEPKDAPGTGANSWIGFTGGGNTASGNGSAVAAGTSNVASGQGSFVGAGTANQANGTSSLVIGGFDNRATVIDSVVVAGAGNRATGARSVVVGGGYNLASGQWSFVGGGGRQTANAGGAGTFIEDNVAAGDFSVVGGGRGNRATAYAASVTGGFENSAINAYSNVLGGYRNVASGNSSAVIGGTLNEAAGSFAIAAGYDTRAGYGSFVWSSPASFPFDLSMNQSRFAIRALDAINMVYAINLSTGGPTQFCNLIPGLSGWQCSSDANLKENFVPADSKAVLEHLAAMPLYSWNFKGSDPGLRSLGPTAQDFHAAFGLGNDDKTIGSTNLHGVALAAIQGLHRLVQESSQTKDDEIALLKDEAHKHEQEIATLEGKLAQQTQELAQLKSAVATLLSRPPLAVRAALE